MVQLYVVYKTLTLDPKKQIDWQQNEGKRYSMQTVTRESRDGYIDFSKMDFKS